MVCHKVASVVPVLANIFAHHVVDKWFQETVKPNCKGRVEIFRYADDMIIVSQYKNDGERIKEALSKRLAKHKLELNEDKTKIVEFSGVKAMQGKKQGSFDFLGFTWYIGRSQKGNAVVKVKTIGKRMRAKLKKVGEWARKVRNEMKWVDIWELCRKKVDGHIRYYGVSFNYEGVAKFRDHVKGIMFKWMNRRSQRKSMSWDEYIRFERSCPLPRARIVHSMFTSMTCER